MLSFIVNKRGITEWIEVFLHILFSNSSYFSSNSSLTASSLTQAWCALTRSGQVDSRANRRRQRQCLLMPPVVGAPSEGDFQAEGEARMKMKPKAHFQPLTPFQSPRSIPKGPDPKTHFPGPFSKSLLLLHGYHFQAHFWYPYYYYYKAHSRNLININIIIIINSNSQNLIIIIIN